MVLENVIIKAGLLDPIRDMERMMRIEEAEEDYCWRERRFKKLKFILELFYHGNCSEYDKDLYYVMEGCL